MFNNIGGKIKGLAQVIAWIGIIASFIIGINLMSTAARFGSYSDSSLIGGLGSFAGILVIVIGSLFSWIGSFVLYGFGQLVENSDTMIEMMDEGSFEKMLRKMNEMPSDNVNTPSAGRRQYNNCRKSETLSYEEQLEKLNNDSEK